MDSNKKDFLLLWFSKVWGQTLKSLSDLQDGCFFLHVMRKISHWKEQGDSLNEYDSPTRIQAVKTFLHDFYGTDASKGVLEFDAIFSDDVDKREMDLAKVAVVLLGIAVIDKQGGDIVKKASMELPEHLQADVVSVLEPVLQTHGTTFVLSASLEEALQTPPVASSSSHMDRMSTPLSKGRKGSDTPLSGSVGIRSSFRDLIISTVSPFVTFIQSPQLIRKEKELELRQLKDQLNEQVLLKEEAQMSLREQIEHMTKKDSEIDELRNGMKELQGIQDSYDELLELKPKLAGLEAKCEKLTAQQQMLDQIRTECQMLERETMSQRDEIHRLHQENHSLKIQSLETTELLKRNRSLEKQLEILTVEFEDSCRMKRLMKEEVAAVRGNLEIHEKKYKELKQLTEETNDAPIQGESMGVIVDIQLGEMKSKMDELSQEKYELQLEVHSLQISFAELNSVQEEMRKKVESSGQLNEKLTLQLREKCFDLNSLKAEMAGKELDNKSSLASLKVKHEEEMKVIQIENERYKSSLKERGLHESSLKERGFHDDNSDLACLKAVLGEKLMSSQGETSELNSHKAGIEEELACLRQENSDKSTKGSESTKESESTKGSDVKEQLTTLQHHNSELISANEAVLPTRTSRIPIRKGVKIPRLVPRQGSRATLKFQVSLENIRKPWNLIKS